MDENSSSKKKKRNEKLIMPEIKTESDRQKALERALENIEKQFGKGAVMRFGDSTKNSNIPVVPTGSIGLDVILGVGGIPRGRIIEIYGPESSGKTTVALHCVAEVQKRGGICGYVDAEHALDPVYAKKLGVDIDELYISQPDDGEQALEICEAMVRSCAIDLVIVDSVAALTPKAEIEGDMGDSHMGLQARLMSQALRKLTAIANKSYCTVIFINQLRDKIGGSGYGPSETTTGGRALKFYASVRIDIRKSENLKMGDDFVGSRTKVKVAKNKVAPPFKTTEFDIMYGEGISKLGELVDLGVEANIVTKSGAWFSYNANRLGQGRENAKSYLRNNPDVAAEIEAAIRNAYSLPDMETIMARLRNLVIDVEAVAAEKPKASKSKASKGKSKNTDEIDDIEIEEALLEEIEIVEEDYDKNIETLDEFEDKEFEDKELED